MFMDSAEEFKKKNKSRFSNVCSKVAKNSGLKRKRYKVDLANGQTICTRTHVRNAVELLDQTPKIVNSLVFELQRAKATSIGKPMIAVGLDVGVLTYDVVFAIPFESEDDNAGRG